MGHKLNRKTFIESCGATCKNWTWSWSFVNHEEKFVIFGEWEDNTDDGNRYILSTDWKIGRSGRRNSGYSQALEHIDLIESHAYSLFTFPMQHGESNEEAESGLARIGTFTPVLTKKALLIVKDKWFAVDINDDIHIPEEVIDTEVLVEGALVSITVNGYERNPIAREKCLNHHGYSCAVCDFDFGDAYGALGNDYIHVHHIVPLAQIRKEYVVDPINDLVPVCANCHAMLHRQNPPVPVTELRRLMEKQRKWRLRRP